MRFSNSSWRDNKAQPQRRKSVTVFCVGWRAFVNLPQPAGAAASLPMTDAAGNPLANDLADGEEVEIISWRPRPRENATYQIRRSTGGSEGWVEVDYLRRSRVAPAPAQAASVT